MERFKIEKIEDNKTYFSLLINDTEQSINFWVDCSINNDFIEWEFNQYIFNLNNEKDLRIKEYQENVKNIGNLDAFIACKSEEIKKDLLFKQYHLIDRLPLKLGYNDIEILNNDLLGLL